METKKNVCFGDRDRPTKKKKQRLRALRLLFYHNNKFKKVGRSTMISFSSAETGNP